MEIPECDGRCCAVFPFSTPIDRARDPKVRSIAVKLSEEEAEERIERFGLTFYNHSAAGVTENSGSGELYKCRHWDEVTGLCGIYEDRPQMCRDYPYTQPCVHCGGGPQENFIHEYQKRFYPDDT
jgi:Fe-S-cluster containining protein